LGERPLGIEVGQLVSPGEWLQSTSHPSGIRLESRGIRSEMAALLARALMPSMFSEVVIANGIPSLQYLLDTPVPYLKAPDLFCLDLLRRFDIPVLARMPAKAKIAWTHAHRGPKD
jgi:hypothetical protein